MFQVVTPVPAVITFAGIPEHVQQEILAQIQAEGLQIHVYNPGHGCFTVAATLRVEGVVSRQETLVFKTETEVPTPELTPPRDLCLCGHFRSEHAVHQKDRPLCCCRLFCGCPTYRPAQP